MHLAGLMSQLRWTLLVIGVLFIVALTWWERRRPRQANGAFERMPLRESADPAPRVVREPPLTLPEVRVHEPVVAAELPVLETGEEPPLPVLEAAAGELHAPVGLEESPAVAAAPEDEDTVDDIPVLVLDEEAAARQSAASTAEPPHEELPTLAGAPSVVVDWPAEQERRILALRLVAPQRERFAGRSLRQALAAEGFLLGQFAIFHRADEERRAVLSAASLTRPGTFDMDTMDSQHFGGLSLFAVLPGPKPARQAFDELVFAARNLNERLHGVLQDEEGSPLTPARIEQLRAQLAPGAEHLA